MLPEIEQVIFIHIISNVKDKMSYFNDSLFYLFVTFCFYLSNSKIIAFQLHTASVF